MGLCESLLLLSVSGCEKSWGERSCVWLGGCAIGRGAEGEIGDMLCLRIGEMFDQKMLQAFRQASTMIQESLNLSQVPSPDGCLVYF